MPNGQEKWSVIEQSVKQMGLIEQKPLFLLHNFGIKKNNLFFRDSMFYNFELMVQKIKCVVHSSNSGNRQNFKQLANIEKH